jgi:hypothetical protein
MWPDHWTNSKYRCSSGRCKERGGSGFLYVEKDLDATGKPKRVYGIKQGKTAYACQMCWYLIEQGGWR